MTIMNGMIICDGCPKTWRGSWDGAVGAGWTLADPDPRQVGTDHCPDCTRAVTR